MSSEQIKDLIDNKQEIIEKLKIAGLTLIKDYLEKNIKDKNLQNETSMSLEI